MCPREDWTVPGPVPAPVHRGCKTLHRPSGWEAAEATTQLAPDARCQRPEGAVLTMTARLHDKPLGPSLATGCAPSTRESAAAAT
jgi:hypothetical protein